MRNTRNFALAVTVALWLAAPAVRAAEDQMPAAARAELKLAQESFGKKDWNGVLDHSRKAAELAPRSLEAQEAWISDHRFVTLTTMTPPKAHEEFLKIFDTFKKKAAKEPKDAFWQILLGQVQFYEDPKASRLAFQKAAELDPSNTEALEMLGVIAETQGNNAEARRFFLRAAQAAPNDPKAAGSYVGSFMDGGDFATFRDKALELIHKFPDSPEAAKWYYWIGTRADAPEEGRRYLQEAIDKYPVAGKSEEDLGWLTSCYEAFFTSLQKDDPVEAERFARSTMEKFAGNDGLVKEWFHKYRRQAEFNLARAARRAKDGKAALELIASVEKAGGKYDSMKDAVIYEKALDQDAAGDSTAALETLLGMLKGGANAEADAAYRDIAKRLGKTEAQAEATLWQARMKDAKPFEDFTLKDADGKSVSLHDLKGRVVLVNFWYPSCGPCRGEFPHLEKITERFRSRPFTVLAINTHPKENFKVKGFIEGNGYQFHALETPTDDWAEKNYKVVGTPSNFLLDENGKIVAEPRLYDQETEERLGQLITELLAKNGAPAKAGS